MKNTYEIYLISDSTGETIDRIFVALKSQFPDFKYNINNFSFTRTQNQIKEIIKNTKNSKNVIILYTLVEDKLSEFLLKEAKKKRNSMFWSSG